ncbi:TetR/AcrR family transcriptional regulator [Actinomadura livida]|uniref:AcrR family transcriptional regulator n=1 Tax=Actinomadura livida TaxID=79909 RepID=A0A7W7IDU6_9ACTN|nr:MULTISPECIES: TetR/AcrR family transcriptional regulator [Actinomadura]MBB4775287.1 AcrR family transcriptional regulator [Actinomadura catellatispora]GGT89226.1 TetR family transcriptional regulator [Actinomadura livida]
MAGTDHVNIWMRPERPARGPRPAYSRAQITEAAIRVADAEGLEAATMRRIAAEIGAGAMSLYRYVPGRGDLVELMADRVMGEIDLEGVPSGDWRADLTRYAEGLRAMWLRHPWIAAVHRSLPGLGPNQLRLIERVAAVLDLYVSVDEGLSLMSILTGYVESAARDEVGQAEEARRSGLTAAEWMTRNSPYVRRLVDSGEYPMFTKIVLEARQPHLDPGDRFRYGLERVLDCLATPLSSPHEPRPRDETFVTGSTHSGTTNDAAPATPCPVCGGDVPETPTGRPRRYCSPGCRQRAYRTRKTPGP